MFDTLSDKLQNVLGGLKGQGRLSEEDVNKAMREIRLALLEADVNFKVVKQFVAAVKERALGEEVTESLTPGQQVVKIVHEELVKLMGASSAKLSFSPKPPTVVLMVGLQGSGKTTTCAKLARNLLSQGKQPELVAADIYRPAAIEQLRVLGEQVKVPVFTIEGSNDAVRIAKKGVEDAAAAGRDVVIIDTAGRLHIDEKLMDELVQIRSQVKPHNILLVLDAMTGQDAVNVAEQFQQQVNFDGVVLTKLDGDARGGAALSVRAVTGKPIKFASTGEKIQDFDYFHPDRMASRILGMGDVLTLIERAQENIDEKKARELEAKLRKAQFTFDDFLDQMQSMRKMGPLAGMLSMIPGIPKQLKSAQLDERELDRVEAIIRSMTLDERRHPEIINGSRRRRIAAGSGTNIQAVNQLISKFRQMQKMMKQLAGGKMKGLPPELLGKT
ncbi:MAG: signal recognition particle protein [Actinomycetota bacterium]|nr:signal recognition particle protein [Actinomycetota bacterium]MCL6093036.1 signal recognition particle protein [Actinomycetota bacterium]MDA8167365.1 signal recognition particle protein [Actinomycetota bacterium]